jgi:tripartite-type tricarboxylate transporter receptor subunit TctC
LSIGRRTSIFGAALAALLISFGSVAQDYPSKSIRLVVPFPAGGTTDVIARIVAQRMSDTMGQQVVVENRGGAGGSLGADAVAKAAPDGYTILMHNITFPTTSAALGLAGRLPHDLEKDFAPISLVVNVPFVLIAHPSVPAQDLKQFVELLKNDRNLRYNYGSTGPGSIMNLQGELLKREGQIEMEHVAFRGAAPMLQEVAAGRIQFGGDQLSTSLSHIRAGNVRALATAGSKRIAALPNVPTVRELGFAKMEAEGWNGLFAPAKTPQPVIDRLNREAVAAARHPDVVKRFEELAAEPVGSSPAELGRVVKAQYETFRPLIKELGLQME